MIAKETAEKFLNRKIGLERNADGGTNFFRGMLKSVTDKDILIEFRGSLQTFSLESINYIRELKKDESG